MMTGEIPVEFPFYALGSLNSIPGVFLILIKYSLQCDKKCDRIIDERATSAFKLGQKTQRRGKTMNEEKKELEEIKEEENDLSEADLDSVETETETESEITDGDTLTPSDDEDKSEEIVDEDGEEEIVEDTEPAPAEKMLTQSQVNELVGRVRQEAREAAMREIRAEMLERYGVSNDVELNEIFGKGQTYDDLDMEYQNQGNAYRSVMAENALLKSHIDPARWEDVKLILGGKGLEVNAENIEGMIATHPEWRGAVNEETGNKILSVEDAERMASNKVIGGGKPATLNKLGAEASPVNEESEEDKVRKLFGM